MTKGQEDEVVQEEEEKGGSVEERGAGGYRPVPGQVSY